MSLEQAVPQVHARLFIQRAVFVQLCYVPAAIPVAGDGTRNKTVFTSQRSSECPGPRAFVLAWNALPPVSPWLPPAPPSSSLDSEVTPRRGLP